MITDVVLRIVALFVGAIVGIFSSLSFLIPDAFENALITFVGYAQYVQGLFPIVANPSMSGLAGTMGMVDLLGYMLQFVVIWYTMKIILFAFGLIPWFGKDVRLGKAKQIEVKK